MARRTLLREDDLRRNLADVPAWTRKGATIERTWRFADFRAALDFINRVGELAESMDHHPDIENSYDRVTLRLTTHDRGGLTALDFELARKIDALG